MAKILPDPDNDLILCKYVNETSNIHIARITNIPNWYFERVVFPEQNLVFEAKPNAILEIYSGMMLTATLKQTIPCKSLIINLDSEEQVVNADKQLILSVDVSSDASTDAVALELANLCKAISAYHIACDGTGLAVDDWEIQVLARQLVGV